ncbi:hypothetical protein ACHWQZ_G008229 [Mnemiopsis leidyi]
MRTILLLIGVLLGGCVNAGRYDLTVIPAAVTSTSDFYKPGTYPFEIRLVMSPVTKDMDAFSLKFFTLQSPWGEVYKAEFIIRTDGSSWENYKFENFPDNYNLALKQGVTIPGPDGNGLYQVDLVFSEAGMKAYIMGIEVLVVEDSNLVAEIKSWDDSISDLGISFNPVLPSLMVQLVPELTCPPGTSISGDKCETCPIGTYSTSENSAGCTSCNQGSSTILPGAVSETQCIEVCTVPTVANATKIEPSSGTRVAAYSLVNVTCKPGSMIGGVNNFNFSCQSPFFIAYGNPSCSDTYRKTVICEGNTAVLACPEEQILRMHNVSWGASTGELCSKTAAAQQSCPESHTAALKVYSLCTDKTSCEIVANAANLGDECTGVPKLLYIEHQCFTYPRSGYSWQRIPDFKTPYRIRDQPMIFRFTPLPDTNSTRRIRFRNEKGEYAGKIVWTHNMSRINECFKKDINIEDYFTATHEWTVSLTKDFVTLSQNGIPLSRWNIATDSTDDNDDITYWITVDDKTALTVALSQKPLTTHYLQIKSIDTGGDIRVLVTDSVDTTAEFKVTTTAMEYWIWGCTDTNMAIDGKCDTGQWEFVLQKTYLEIACDGYTLLHFEFDKALVADPAICVSKWDVDFVSLKFFSDTATEKYRFINIPEGTGVIDPTDSTDLGSVFPIKESTTSTWSWAHDGSNENGILKLFANGTVYWNEEKSGSWNLANGGTILEASFNDISHKLEYNGDKEQAVLISPVREPPSTMKLIASQQGAKASRKRNQNFAVRNVWTTRSIKMKITRQCDSTQRSESATFRVRAVQLNRRSIF